MLALPYTMLSALQHERELELERRARRPGRLAARRNRPRARTRRAPASPDGPSAVLDRKLAGLAELPR